VLASLGWLPPLGIDRAAIEPAASQDITTPPRDAWIARYFNAARRAAPRLSGTLSDTVLRRALRVGRRLVDEQTYYHTMRGQRSARATRLLSHWADLLLSPRCLGYW
jgi:hypothetical protein